MLSCWTGRATGFLFLFLFVALRSDPSEACTVFAVTSPEGGKVAFVGKSYDWGTQAAMVVRNSTGVTKRAVTFPSGDYRGPPALPKVAWEWTSRLSSVTFDQYGRDFPIAGMNEAGLVVESAEMDPGDAYKSESYYVPPGATHVVSMNQWMQYLLDTFSTVQDVVAELQSPPPYALMPSTVPLHFMICDVSGCVVVEVEKNALVVRQGQELGVQPPGEAFLPVAALTNDFYGCSSRGRTDGGLHSLSDYQGFGGKRPVPSAPFYCVQDYDAGTASAAAGTTTVAGVKTDWLSLWRKWGPSADGGFTIRNEAIGTWRTVATVTSPTRLTLSEPAAAAWSGAYTFRPSFPANSIPGKCAVACRSNGAWLNSNSIQRFVRAAQTSRDLSAKGATVADVFTALNSVYSDSVETGGTMWQIAYDVPGRRVHWRTIANGSDPSGFTGRTFSTSAAERRACETIDAAVANIDGAPKCVSDDNATCNPNPDLSRCSAKSCPWQPYRETWNKNLVAFAQSHSSVDLSGFEQLVTGVLPGVSAGARQTIISNIWGGYPRGYTTCGGEVTTEGVVNLFLSSALNPYLKNIGQLLPGIDDGFPVKREVEYGSNALLDWIFKPPYQLKGQITGLGKSATNMGLTLTKLEVTRKWSIEVPNGLQVEGTVPLLRFRGQLCPDDGILGCQPIELDVPVKAFAIRLQPVRVSDDYDELLCFEKGAVRASPSGPIQFGKPTKCRIGSLPEGELSNEVCGSVLSSASVVLMGHLLGISESIPSTALRPCKGATTIELDAGVALDPGEPPNVGGAGCSCGAGGGGATASIVAGLLLLAFAWRRRRA